MSPKVVSSSVWLMILLVLALAVSSSIGDNEISCEQAIVNLLGPCRGFLTGNGNAPTLACCQGVAKVNTKVNTTANRRTLCPCFKNAANAMRVIPDRADLLTKACNVDLIKVPVNPNVDCSRIPSNIDGDQEQKRIIHN